MSNQLTDMTLRLYYKGQASALNTKKHLIHLYEDDKITFYDFTRAIKVLG